MYNRTEKIVMWLSTFDFMSYKLAKFIVDNYEDLEDLFDNLEEETSEEENNLTFSLEASNDEFDNAPDWIKAVRATKESNI